VVTSTRGLIYSVHIATGHNNDQGLFNKTLRNEVEEKVLIGLGDRGYSFPIVVPNMVPKDSELNPLTFSKQHAASRAPAEIGNALTKRWSFAERKCTLSPEHQAMGLHIIYCLVNLELHQNPSRLFPNSGSVF